MPQKLGATMVDISREEGQVIASRRHLRVFLEGRFGSLSDELRRRIEESSDLERLEQEIYQTATMQSLNDLTL